MTNVFKMKCSCFVAN